MLGASNVYKRRDVLCFSLYKITQEKTGVNKNIDKI